jgi:hypothetical protein
MLRVIDARSGVEVRLGDTVRYGEGDFWRLLDLEHGLAWATAWIDGEYDGQAFGPKPLPLQVRFTHPGFFLQRVAFAPT